MFHLSLTSSLTAKFIAIEAALASFELARRRRIRRRTLFNMFRAS